MALLFRIEANGPVAVDLSNALLFLFVAHTVNLLHLALGPPLAYDFSIPRKVRIRIYVYVSG